MIGIIKELERCEQAANEAEEAWEKDPDNLELERAFDEAYIKETEVRDKAIETLISLTDGFLTKADARFMLGAKRDEIKNIIKSM